MLYSKTDKTYRPDIFGRFDSGADRKINKYHIVAEGNGLCGTLSLCPVRHTLWHEYNFDLNGNPHPAGPNVFRRSLNGNCTKWWQRVCVRVCVCLCGGLGRPARNPLISDTYNVCESHFDAPRTVGETYFISLGKTSRRVNPARGPAARLGALYALADETRYCRSLCGLLWHPSIDVAGRASVMCSFWCGSKIAWFRRAGRRLVMDIRRAIGTFVVGGHICVNE